MTVDLVIIRWERTNIIINFVTVYSSNAYSNINYLPFQTNNPGQTNLNKTDSTFEKAYLDSKGRVIEAKAYQNGVFTHYIEHLYAVLPK